MEQSFVAWAKMRARRLPQVKLGIGDDAAIVDFGGSDVVVTSDSLLDGVHFELHTTQWRRIGRKLVGVNLSDLAAMAAEPTALFLSLCLPSSDARAPADQLAAELFEGVCEAAERYGVAIAGGDTNCWPGPLALHLTAIGKVIDGKVWTRSGAQPGDAIVVTGPLGGSLLGKHLDFEPRLDWARRVRGAIDIHAAMDISDGLSIDLLRMSDASHCGAILQTDDIPLSAAAQDCARVGTKTALEHALGDGEDFELLVAVPAAAVPALQDLVGPEQAVVCGEFTSRTGLWAREGSTLRQLATTGYIHGSQPTES